ncbi:hypothetical protein ACTXT7_011622 [Hymenolepis weldensis]
MVPSSRDGRKRRMNMILVALPSNLNAQFPIPLLPSNGNTYQTLKNDILKRIGFSNFEQYQNVTLGDMKPSQLIGHMQFLASTWT